MTFHVDSEVGPLAQVILHKPGIELLRLTPDNVKGLLFDDVMWAEKAQEEHEQFQQILRDLGVTVHLYQDLLAEALAQDGARDELAAELITETQFGTELDGPLQELLDERTPDQLAELLIGGMLKREAAPHLGGVSSLLLHSLDDDDFLLAPLPNHLFQRDNSAWIYAGVNLNPMAKPARQRETINSRLIYNFHPMFTAEEFVFYNGNDPMRHTPATIEGGDILVIGNRTVMIGMSERTAPQGIEVLAENLFKSGTVDKVIVVELPMERAFMHLDTAMTQVDRDAFSVYPYLPDTLRSYTLVPRNDQGHFTVTENAELFAVVAEALGVDTLRVLKAPIDRLEAARAQWDDGNNFLTVSPGVVVGYERNVTTNKYLGDNGIQVIAMSGSELGRGRGGPRCMSCPIEREA
ncbi:arginine deiminase ArcA [Gordonia polyisoprenivorans VH2]|uniref:Arginine deiminase ArcA n=2 Tax=Gordonia polyisoprenivorans TaxID=84595 RepID=H6N0E2_GORPV|nr:arginine deiminase [Gordonia polyisoprenivorans]AFA72046.1 arginine deiminase ArcA [Gordonia polyisoprenivorans VH2]MBE7194891.1 arginine deiminase [Gordonia polyisoprenivorans]NKY00226.1 arginine deiminase [Gordonia polyisoprenivorans]OZC33884.1 arginine deiminase [Gordonia polyisoprenivorans]QUD81859.1 arginine deiminase [Gordonia polyisoprenivorans]